MTTVTAASSPRWARQHQVLGTLDEAERRQLLDLNARRAGRVVMGERVAAPELAHDVADSCQTESLRHCHGLGLFRRAKNEL